MCPAPLTIPNQHAWLIEVMMLISAVLFVASVFTALWLRKASAEGRKSRSEVEKIGYLMLGAWVLLPPIWFFAEFQLLHTNIFGDQFEMARVKHSQELARNIWLAFVVVLAAVIGVKWPPGEAK